jgi:hypothetical protein
VSVAAEPASAAPAAPPSALAVAMLFVRARVRFLWNGMRVRGRGRFPTLVLLVGVLTSLAYVGLFFQAFSVVIATVAFPGQLAVLALAAGTVAFGSLTAKAASSEAVLAGSAENEFLMARPVSLRTVVVARCLAESVTDPFGALFLLPVLLAAAIGWGLPLAAVLVAALSSMVTQLAIGALSQAAQIALARFVPRARRRAAWMLLRLVALLSLALLWMMLSWVLRAPAELGRALGPLAPWAAASPGGLIVRPLAAFVRGGAGDVLLGLAMLVGAAGASLLLAVAVAGRAAARGWEEAGTPWAEAATTARPAAGAGPARETRIPLTAATKDLLLILRDRTQLLALIMMPVIFVGVQLFGSAGWSWSTATLQRVTYLAFSLTLYMATIGPLAHMQAERRAFWILRAVPVPPGRLLAAKARAWSVVVGATAALVFAALSLGAPAAGPGAWLGAGLMVVGGAVGMTWLAVALASRAADLSDEQRPAIGPATIYTFLLVGGLYNVILGSDGPERLRGLAVYLFALGAYWLDGVEQARICLDPEWSSARRLTLADGATMTVVYALGPLAAERTVRLAVGASPIPLVASHAAVMAVVGVAALLYLARTPRGPARSGLAASAGVALAAGLATSVLLRALGLVTSGLAVLFSRPRLAAGLSALLLGEELVFRGVVQRGLEPVVGRWLGAAASAALSLVAFGAMGYLGIPFAVLLVSHAVAALVQAITGRTTAAWLARVVGIVVAVAVAGPG